MGGGSMAKEVATKAVAVADRKVFSIDSLEFVARKGRGGAPSPIAEKAMGLKHGEGFRVSESEYGLADKSHLVGGWGLVNVFNAGRRKGYSFRCRKTTDGKFILYRDSKVDETIRVNNWKVKKLEKSKAAVEDLD